jgi:hypothetical protein
MLDRSLRAVESALEDRRLRIGAAIVGFGLATLFCSLYAWPSIHVTLHEDEAYMLTTLKSFMHHGHLYDRVFSQYGPFYSEFWAGVFSLFGIPETHDAARAITTCVWVGSTLGLGLALLRITRSVFLGIAVQVLSFSALGVLTAEPLHPGGLICMLLVAIVLVAAFVTERPAQLLAAALGALVGALVLTKINVGGFALLSLALTCTVVYPTLARLRWPRAVVEVVFVVVPLAVTASKWGQGWAWHFGVHVSIAALAVVIALRARRTDQRADGELWWIAGGFLVLAVLICAAILGAGTSLGGLVDGVVTQPLRQGEAFTVPFVLSPRIWAFDAIGLAGALAFWGLARSGAPVSAAVRSFAAAASVMVGVEMALTLVGKTLPANPLDLAGVPVSLLAFVWVALVPPASGERRVGFAVLLLPVLAVLQPLHAFPVAGSQVFWGTFLLVGVAAICVANGVRSLFAGMAAGREREITFALATAVAIVIAAFAVNATLREGLVRVRGEYHAAVPLDLPGATDVRVTEAEAVAFRAITAAIDRECPASFMTEPGMMNFYIWTEKEPPTGMNATAWMTLFDDHQEQQVVEETSSIEGLCLLRNTAIAEYWSSGPVPPGPLVENLKQGFRPIATFGDYELLKREGKSPDTASGRPS